MSTYFSSGGLSARVESKALPNVGDQIGFHPMEPLASVQRRAKASHYGISRNGRPEDRLTKERPEQNSQSGPVEQAQTRTPHQEQAKRMNEESSANFAIRMRYKGEERTTELPLTHDMIGQLAFEAELRDMGIGELIGELTVAMLKKVLEQKTL